MNPRLFDHPGMSAHLPPKRRRLRNFFLHLIFWE